MKTSIAPTIQQKIQIPYNYSAGPAMTKFLRGLKDKVIYASLCASCGKRSVPPLSFCGRCWQPIDSYVPVEQVGAVESFVAPAAFPAELSSHPSGAGFYAIYVFGPILLELGVVDLQIFLYVRIVKQEIVAGGGLEKLLLDRQPGRFIDPHLDQHICSPAIPATQLSL